MMVWVTSWGWPHSWCRGGGGAGGGVGWCGRGREDPTSQKQQHKLSDPEVPVSRISSHPEFKITPPRRHPAAAAAAAPGWLTRSPWKQPCTKHTYTHKDNRVATRPSLLQVSLKAEWLLIFYSEDVCWTDFNFFRKSVRIAAALCGVFTEHFVFFWLVQCPFALITPSYHIRKISSTNIIYAYNPIFCLSCAYLLRIYCILILAFFFF